MRAARRGELTYGAEADHRFSDLTISQVVHYLVLFIKGNSAFTCQIISSLLLLILPAIPPQVHIPKSYTFCNKYHMIITHM